MKKLLIDKRFFTPIERSLTAFCPELESSDSLKELLWAAAANKLSLGPNARGVFENYHWPLYRYLRRRYIHFRRKNATTNRPFIVGISAPQVVSTHFAIIALITTNCNRDAGKPQSPICSQSSFASTIPCARLHHLLLRSLHHPLTAWHCRSTTSTSAEKTKTDSLSPTHTTRC